MHIKSGLAYARVWHLVDCKGKSLGRLANRISIALRGKYKPHWDPLIDCGDYVVVINARHIEMPPKQQEEKMYFWHSKYPGGVTHINYKTFIAGHPTGPLKKAIYGMLPKNKMRKDFMSRCFLFADDDHPFTANILRSYDTPAPKATTTPDPELSQLGDSKK
ncbi:54S ribosomal protein L23, mitochondrial [Borealophlyctis nickersoniae]|nr:54S ribosomal protein L23, mitochondrial [Borealophlyctis nickersoniae]